MDNKSEFPTKTILDYFAANPVAANLIMLIMLLIRANTLVQV